MAGRASKTPLSSNVVLSYLPALIALAIPAVSIASFAQSVPPAPNTQPASEIHPERLFRLTVDDGVLRLASDLPGQNHLDDAEVDAQNHPIAQSPVKFVTRNPRTGALGQFVFSVRETDRNDAQVVDQIFLSPRQLLLQQVSYSPKLTSSVQLAQVIDYHEKVASVTLIVTETPEGGEPRNVCRIQSPSFDALLAEHVPEADRYLQPMLQSPNFGSLMGSRTSEAVQVLAGEMAINPAAEAQVKSLINALASDRAAEREDATNKLRALGPPAAAVMLRLDRSALSAEQLVRIDRLLAPWRPLPRQEAMQRRDDVRFLLNCLLNGDLCIRQGALARLRAVTHREVDFNLDADSPARRARVAELRKGLLLHATTH